ncbi:MAG: hypothetical protein JW727_06870 [Candidatus Aenigmarchaeota archaeon]|nr:hypothetical protein [Candidatus Aenigmarchaeota archaeon]
MRDLILKKVKNGIALLDRYDQNSGEQKKDALAEIEVAIHYIEESYTLEYEPGQLKKPPEFKISGTKDPFYVEVKRIHDPVYIKRQTGINDLNSRLEKILLPYVVQFYPNQNYKLSQNKKIVDIIHKEMNPQVKLLEKELILNSTRIGKFILEKNDGSSRCQLGLCGVQLESRIDSIRTNLEDANRKDIPKGSKYILFIKIDYTFTPGELEVAPWGDDVLRMQFNKQNGSCIREDYLKQNKRLGHSKHFKKIGGLVYFGSRLKYPWTYINPK